MATYKGIQGYSVQKLSSDPTASEADGQLWYNSSGGKFKLGTAGDGTWATGGTMSLYYGGGFTGTQTAGVYAGGVPGPTNTTSLYDGTSWTVNPSGLDTARTYITNAGVGPQTAAMVAGGQLGPGTSFGGTEWFDGSTWTEKADLGTARDTLVVAGSQTAALGMTGSTYPSPTIEAAVEVWDGSSWTAGTAAPQAKYYAAGGGTPTSAIVCGGSLPPQTNTADEWNGTSWTEIANMNSARQQSGAAAPSGTSALVFGGEEPPRVAKTEKWNGSTWTEVADLGTANNNVSGGGTTSIALCAGGESPNNGATYEWNDPVYTIKTVTVS